MVSTTRLIKRLLPRSLLGRSLLILVTPLVVLQLVSAYVFYGTHWDTMSRRLAAGIAGDISAVIELMRAYPGPGNRDWLFDIVAGSMDLRVRLIEGGILPNSPPPATTDFLEAPLSESLQERIGRPFRIDADSFPREVQIDIQLPDGVLQVMAPRKRLSSSTTYIFVLWMVGTSMLLFGIATIFMRNQVRSVRRLAAAADSFGKGRDVASFKPEGATEVRQAAVAFNLMRERLKRQIAQRTEMLAGVSHDLRTPLTRMKLQLAMMPEDEDIAALKEDVGDMERMVEGYLAFARGEGGEKVCDTDLTALLEDAVARYRRDGKAVDLHCEGEIFHPLRPHAFSRCLANLIGNACRYGSHVSVRAGRRGEAVEISIDDDGPGIPFAKREEVFKAFVRLDSSRNAKTGGVGLGLTIARDVVRGLGGDILLEDSPLGGLRARIRLPL